MIQFQYPAHSAPPTFCIQHIATSWNKEKTPLNVYLAQRSLIEQKRPWQRFTLCQGRIKHLSAVPPWFTVWPVRLAGYQHIPGKWRLPATSQNTLWESHLTAPSAVHLTTCFLPDSQHRRLSVKASLPLSPLQRFILLNFFTLYHLDMRLSRGLAVVYMLDRWVKKDGG